MYIEFKSLEEMKPYYGKHLNTYVFVNRGDLITVEFLFDLDIDSHIEAANIYGKKIKALDLDCNQLRANEITCTGIYANVIEADKINCSGHIEGNKVTANYLAAEELEVFDIYVKDLQVKEENIGGEVHEEEEE